MPASQRLPHFTRCSASGAGAATPTYTTPKAPAASGSGSKQPVNAVISRAPPGQGNVNCANSNFSALLPCNALAWLWRTVVRSTLLQHQFAHGGHANSVRAASQTPAATPRERRRGAARNTTEDQATTATASSTSSTATTATVRPYLPDAVRSQPRLRMPLPHIQSSDLYLHAMQRARTTRAAATRTERWTPLPRSATAPQSAAANRADRPPVSRRLQAPRRPGMLQGHCIQIAMANSARLT